MDSFWCNFLPIVVGIGAAILGGLIGWHLRRPRIKELESIVDEKHAEYIHLKNASEMRDIKHHNLQKEQVSLSVSHNTLQERIDILEEDLTAIESAKAVLTKHFVNYRTTAENRIEEFEQTNQEWSKKYNFLLARYESQNNSIAELENVVAQRDDNFIALNAEREQNAKRIAELEELKDEWESSYYAIFNENKTNINHIAEMQRIIDEKESNYRTLINQHGASVDRIAEMQALIEEKESRYQLLFNHVESKEQQLAELEETNQQWIVAFEELDNEQSVLKSQIETLQQTLVSIEDASNVKYANSDSSIKLYEKELAELQDAKAQLVITRIKLENDLDILRGAHTSVLAEFNALVELEKAGRMRIDYLEQQNFEQRISELETALENSRNTENGSENNGRTILTNIATPIKPDDLKVVEGIGPKIEAVLHDAGILTFEQLAKTDTEHIHAILDAAGPRYRIHNPSTWPTQAELAAKNDWDKLKELKDYLLAGKDRATP